MKNGNFNWKLKSLILTTTIIALIFLLQLSHAGTRTVLGEQGATTGDQQIPGKLDIDDELHITGNNAKIILEDDSGNVSILRTGNSQFTLDADPDNSVASTDIVFKIDESEVGRFWQGGNFEIKEQFKVMGGSPGSGKVLTSDANGLAAWGVSINDQASSNYFDIGTMRIQWGTISYSADDPTAMSLPAAFANTNYSVVLSVHAWDYNADKGPADVSNPVSVTAKSTTTFTANRDNDLANVTTFDWTAIGLKP